MTTREATSLLPRPLREAQSGPVRRPLSERAFTFAWALIQWPWLLRSLSGGARRDKAALLAALDLPPDALPNLGSWKADCFFLQLILSRIAEARPQSVVELGAGASTLVTARALQLHGGGRLTSFDQHGDFVVATRAWLADHGVEADLRVAPLTAPPAGWPGLWYDLANVPDRIDLLLIDGPHWTLHPFVRGAAEILFDRIAVGGMVMLDDGARPGERVVMARWRARWPDFRFERLRGGTKGTIVGTRIS